MDSKFEISLKEIMENTDMDLRKKHIKLKVLENIGSDEFRVAQADFSTVLKFVYKPWESFEKISTGQSICVFGLSRDDNKLLYTKESFFVFESKEVETSFFASSSQEDIIKLENLAGRVDKELITSKLFVKVVSVGPIRPLAKGNQLMKVKIADQNHVITATFFGADCNKFGSVKEGNVITMKNFNVDAFIKDWPVESPRNIVIRSYKPQTEIEKVTDDSYLQKFKNVLEPDDSTFTLGKIRFLSEYREYPACPNCSKGVRGLEVCEKCGVDLTKQDIQIHYNVKLIFFKDDGEMMNVLSFSKEIQKFEVAGRTIEERLSKVLNKDVKIKTYLNKDGNIVLERLRIPSPFDI